MESFVRLLLVVPQESFFSPLQNISIALLLTFFQAILLNRIVNNYNLFGRPSFLPSLMYATAASLLPPFLILSPALLCNFLLIWMIEKFLSIYRRDEARSVMFDLGMMVGFGTLIYFPFIVMFLLLWLSLLIFRPFNWREWVSGLIGFATIYFILAVFYYWNDSLDNFLQIFLPLTNKFPSAIKINLNDYIVLIPVICILALSAISLRQNFFRSYVQVRKSFQLLFFLLVLALISFYLKKQVQVYHFLLAVPAVAIFMAYYFLNAKRRWFYESLYLILIGFIIYFQIF
ncbi:DUF6427 family protein [Rubrolithibacter danxiaensis]|uniref:DUF6427 family protein n=1 Tax=Rubrolithibacter danxiaensis TaxID=3390805 RepID=UPI003BF8DBA2